MVRFGSAFDTTVMLSNLSPPSVSTPATRPFSTMMRFTGIPRAYGDAGFPVRRAPTRSLTLPIPPAGDATRPKSPAKRYR